MDINKNLIEEINRFRMMSGYQPGSLISEQKYTLINEQTYPGVNNITWMEEGFEVGSNRAGYMGKVIGTITDDVLELNEIGNYIFNQKQYPKTIEQVELLETQGKLKISDSDTKIMGNLNQKSNQTEIEPDEVKRRYVRQSKRMYKKTMEQNIEGANWNGESTGTMIIQDKYPTAYNCGVYQGYLWIGSDSVFEIAKPSGPEYQPVYSGTPTPGDRLDDFNIGKDFKVYADNMVQPKIYEGAGKEQFDKIVNDFVEYINNGGFDKLTNVTIQGKADSANPTWDIPKGETSLDHNYDGIKRKTSYTDEELDKMNLFLARERARNYKNKLIQAIKAKTGKEIKITELQPISYRGQMGKRGGEWRSITLMANAPVLEKIEIDPVKLQKYNDYLKTKEETEKQLSSGLYPVTAKIGTTVGLVDVDVDSEGVPLVVSREEVSNSGAYSTKGIYLRVDAVEFYSIPDYPNDAIQNVTLNIKEEISGGSIKFNDSNGKMQRYTLVPFSQADEKGNAVSLGHRKGGGKWSPYMGGSDYNPGASAQGQAYTCPGDMGKIASSVPFTVISPQNKQINYKGNYYVELKNLWFGYTAKYCGDPKIEDDINYYNVDHIRSIFD